MFREVATHCDLFSQIYQSSDNLTQSLDMDPNLINSIIDIDASYTTDIQKYACGDLEAFLEYFTPQFSENEFLMDALLSNRNKQMAEKMDEVMKASPNERIFFAVGAAHWNIGNYSLELLLEDYGYTLERIPDWESESAEDHSDDHCGVVKNSETGLFEEATIPTSAPAAEKTLNPIKTFS